MDVRFTNMLFTLTEMLGERGYDTTPLNDRDRLLRTYGEGSMFALVLKAKKDPLGGGGGEGNVTEPPTVTEADAADAEEEEVEAEATEPASTGPITGPIAGGASAGGEAPALAPLRVVFFPQVNGLKMEHIRKAFDGAADYCLVIHGKDKPKTNVRDAALELEEKLKPTGHVLQMFTVDELQYNVMQHALQPRFERMTREETERMFADHGLTAATAMRQLPRILGDDKVARYMGLRHGDVVRITRSSPTAGEVVLFKICVAGAP